MVMPKGSYVNLGYGAPIVFDDGMHLSAFGRLAVSQSIELFSSQQQYGDDPTEWETALAGTGAVTFLPNESTMQLSTGGTAAGASAIRQTRLYHRYVPGHGQQILQTFCFDGGVQVSGNTRCIGYFDASNGIFLEASGETVYAVRRSNVTGTPVDFKVAQEDWNVDRLDGSGPSGITVDWSKTQILVIDLQWLGVGRARVGFNIDGVLVPVHFFNHANIQPTVYMTTANLPCRVENFNSTTASGIVTMRHICTSVVTGGGAEPSYGKLYTYNNGGAGTVVNTSTPIPIISVRAATTGPNGIRNTGQLSLEQYDVAAVGANPIYWALVLNGTLTGAAFSALNSASIALVDKAAVAITGGTVIDAGYLAASAQAKGISTQFADVKSLILAYSGLLNHQDTLTLACSSPGGSTTAFANMQWLEMW